MRENIRSKQPFHLSLGVKQAAGALVVALVVLGAIFALGLGVGRKSSPPASQPAGGARDALARLDDPLAGKEEPAPELKAHQALTDSRAIEKTMPVPTATAVAKASAPPRADEPPASEQDVVAPPPIAAPGPAPLPLSASSATASQPPQAAGATDGDKLGQGTSTSSSSTAVAQGSAPRAAPPSHVAKSSTPGTAGQPSRARPAADRRRDEVRRSAKEAKAAKARPPALRAGKAKGKGAYTIQIASAHHRADAERAAKRVAARKPRIVAADVPGKGRWYRVQIGSYATRDSARLALASMSGVHGIVTPAR